MCYRKESIPHGFDQPAADRPVANKVEVPIDTEWRYVGSPGLVNNPYCHLTSPPSLFTFTHPLRLFYSSGFQHWPLRPPHGSHAFRVPSGTSQRREAARTTLVDNVFFEREKGLFSYRNNADWMTAEPLWVTAERQRIIAAVYFWVGSETDWQGTGASYRMAPFDGFL
ncbi:MAG TPA: hypothetical protein EYP91_25365 [Gammaproteobacteria bacterium]|nr:hypothetical protein [Gammaproteobacteria bacterium]